MLAVAILIASLVFAVPAADDAGGGDDWGGTATWAENAETEVLVHGTEHNSPHQETTHRADANPNPGNPGSGTPDRGTAPAPDPPEQIDPIAVDCESPAIPCHATDPGPDPTRTSDPDTTTGYPALTISDLATFQPSPPTLLAEPDDAGVVGLPVNLVATTRTQTLRGTVLGFPITVRLTPHHYTFTHGDGTDTTTRTPGTSWTTSKDPQFTPTETSHTYADRGRYAAAVTVSYSAAVDFGDHAWRDIPGFITATSATHTIRIYEAHTALVAHTCTENPSAAGC